MTESPERIEGLLVEVGERMLRAASDRGWDYLRLEVNALSTRAEAQLIECKADGEVRINDPSGADFALILLRKAMSSSDSGAWYTVEVKLTRHGILSLNCDYDSKPRWRLAVSDAAYLIDLEDFPRPADLIPPWHPARR